MKNSKTLVISLLSLLAIYYASFSLVSFILIKSVMLGYVFLAVAIFLILVMWLGISKKNRIFLFLAVLFCIMGIADGFSSIFNMLYGGNTFTSIIPSLLVGICCGIIIKPIIRLYKNSKIIAQSPLKTN